MFVIRYSLFVVRCWAISVNLACYMMSDLFLRMEELPSLQLAAKGITMTMAENRTVELWQSAKPIMMRMQGRRPGFISMEVFPEGINFENFTPRTPFQKWAAVQLDEGAAVPEGLEAYSLQGGLYAVFRFRGLPAQVAALMQHIFLEWIPASEYEVDDREQLAFMPEDYRPDDPDAEEEFFIPVRRK